LYYSLGIATKDARGTLHYCTPEILLSESDIPSYTNKVDIWSVGLLLYEPCMKKRAFQSANAVMRYFWQEETLPLIPDDHPVYGQMRASSSSVYQVDICNAAATMNSLSSGLPVTDFIPSHDFNQHFNWLLQSDQERQPSIDEIHLNFAALRLRLVATQPVGPSEEQKCL
jgi:serine/threonine protein kinase